MIVENLITLAYLLMVVGVGLAFTRFRLGMRLIFLGIVVLLKTIAGIAIYDTVQHWMAVNQFRSTSVISLIAAMLSGVFLGALLVAFFVLRTAWRFFIRNRHGAVAGAVAQELFRRQRADRRIR